MAGKWLGMDELWCIVIIHKFAAMFYQKPISSKWLNIGFWFEPVGL